jgi:pimeloyl-ACP methyl ester carboxylesterase
MQAVQAFDNWPRLGEIRTETLLIHPSEDTKPLERAQAFARGLANAQLHVFAGVGHNVRWEVPEQAARLMVDFYTTGRVSP